MALNDKYFVPPEATQTLLRVRGFGQDDKRSGGLVSPQVVDLPGGTVLFRMYHDPTRDYGEWWATPRELAVIASYFGRGGPAFDEGRSSSKGILHATMAVRHDWGGNSPLHLGMFFAVRLAAAMKAYHGEGDHAPDANQTEVQKAVYIIDAGGRLRRPRQIMLPKAWEFKASLPRIAGGMSLRRDPGNTSGSARWRVIRESLSPLPSGDSGDSGDDTDGGENEEEREKVGAAE
jgi:hypothetical protein